MAFSAAFDAVNTFSSRLALVIAAAAPLVPAGCVLPHTLSWELGWADSTLEDRAVAVEASILEGGCDGTVVWSSEIGLDGSSTDPPDLGKGRYGFAARARDLECRWFAEGCRELDLPTDDNDGDLRVALFAMSEEAACASELCIAGLCACTAPGQCGGACIGDECDCVSGGCVENCLENGACSCTGGGCHMRCEQGSTCDCVGGDCAMDCGPDTICECFGGGCTYACDTGSSCTCQGGGCR